MPVKTLELPSAERLRNHFHYDKETGIVTDNEGSVVHHVGEGGYLLAYLDKGCWRLHRVIWKMVTGEDPVGFEIDHEDRNVQNNRWKNLRKATRSEQKMNCGVQKNSKTGIRGVYPNGQGKFRAKIYVNKVGYELGTYDNIEEAIEARLEGEKKYHGKWSHNARTRNI